MMLDNTPEDINIMSRHISCLPLLRTLDDASIRAFEAELEWLSIPGGWTLFHEGEAADAMYAVVSGSLGVTVRSSEGREITVAHIHAGETVGEMALLAGGLRSATVVAIRDTEVLRLERAGCERLVEQHPKSMLLLISLLAQRLRDSTHYTGHPAAIRTLTLVPMAPDTDCRGVANDLAKELAKGGRRIKLFGWESTTYTSEWFNAAESESDLVLYLGEPNDCAWTKFCLRQADRVLLIAPP